PRCCAAHRDNEFSAPDMDCHATLPRGHATERTVSHLGTVALRDFNPAYDRNGSDSVIRRSFGDVGSMSGLPESGHGLSDLRVLALTAPPAPPFGPAPRPRPRRAASTTSSLCRPSHTNRICWSRPRTTDEAQAPTPHQVAQSRRARR